MQTVRHSAPAASSELVIDMKVDGKASSNRPRSAKSQPTKETMIDGEPCQY
jgi:hypothetical protein